MMLIIGGSLHCKQYQSRHLSASIHHDQHQTFTAGSFLSNDTSEVIKPTDLLQLQKHEDIIYVGDL